MFEHLTVEENLLTGAYTRRNGQVHSGEISSIVYHYFPRLTERRRASRPATSPEASSRWWRSAAR